MLTTTEERKMAGKLSENGTSEKSFNNRILSAKKLNCLPKTRTKKNEKVYTHVIWCHTIYSKKTHIVIAFIEGLKGFVKIK